eukprot:11070392-Alexandrium_andersonii.AAC.1
MHGLGAQACARPQGLVRSVEVAACPSLRPEPDLRDHDIAGTQPPACARGGRGRVHRHRFFRPL